MRGRGRQSETLRGKLINALSRIAEVERLASKVPQRSQITLT